VEHQLIILQRWSDQAGVPEQAAIFAAANRFDDNQSVGQNGIAAGFPLGDPTPFAETVFIARNSLISMRNEIAVSRSMPARAAWTCDSSPLCTVVRLETGELNHTCQSTKTGSGGPILQKVENPDDGIPWNLVGINQGSATQGKVTSNSLSKLR
jgi:hypothetical protein